MLAAYAVIIVGGLLITRRLQLLILAATFWVALAIGVGTLAASSHCIVTRWSFAPVCGFDFWRTIVTSPEVLIFLFFMITDPKTVPAGRVGRMVFGLLVAVASTLLMAPQTDEFGTKVGLLAGLVVVCAARPMFERVLPAPQGPRRTGCERSPRASRGSAARPRARARQAAATALAGVAVLADRDRHRPRRDAGAPARRLRLGGDPGPGARPGRPGDAAAGDRRPGRRRRTTTSWPRRSTCRPWS